MRRSYRKTGIPNNQIWYTSTDGNTVNPYRAGAFGVTIVSNTYLDGKGVIAFDGKVTSVGYNAFRETSRLKSIVLPNSVKIIGDSAFYFCYRLSTVVSNSVTTIGDSAFSGCNSLVSVTIPDSVTTIEGNAFSGCTSLTGIIIPKSVTSIGISILKGCSSLQSIIVDPENTRFDSRDNCNAIIELYYSTYLIQGCNRTVIPDSVEIIDNSAFEGYTDLVNVIIPDSITRIGDKAFYGCSGLESITCQPSTPPDLDNYVFDDTDDCPIYVPETSYAEYLDEWSEYADRIMPY